MSFITIDNSCHVKSCAIPNEKNFEYFEVNAAISTTLLLVKSGAGVQGGYTVLDVSTSSKDSGLYRISYCYSWTNNSESRDFCIALLIDEAIKFQARSAVLTNSGGNDTDDFAIPESGNNQRHTTSGWIYSTLSGVHDIKLIFGRGVTGSGSDSVSISDVRIELVKVM